MPFVKEKENSNSILTTIFQYMEEDSYLLTPFLASDYVQENRLSRSQH